MRVYLGNPQPHEIVPGGEPQSLNGPAVTTFYGVKLAQDHPDDPDAQTFDPDADPSAVALHILRHAATAGPMVTHLPENGALVQFISAMRHHTAGPVSWVATRAENDESPELAADFARFVAALFDAEVGMPADVEETHHTLAGPPGVVDDPSNALQEA